jgi:hypothetical protein
MIGAGVIADGIAVYEGLQAKKKGDELTRQSQMRNVTFDPAIESAGKTANIAAIVLGIGGTALAITGAIILITSGSSSDAPEAAPKAARLRLTPWMGPGLVGGGASLRF